MHIILLLIFLPMLFAAVWMIAIQLPFGLMMEGAADGNPGAVVAGIIVFLVVWGGGFALLARG